MKVIVMKASKHLLGNMTFNKHYLLTAFRKTVFKNFQITLPEGKWLIKNRYDECIYNKHILVKNCKTHVKIRASLFT